MTYLTKNQAFQLAGVSKSTFERHFNQTLLNLGLSKNNSSEEIALKTKLFQKVFTDRERNLYYWNFSSEYIQLVAGEGTQQKSDPPSEEPSTPVMNPTLEILIKQLTIKDEQIRSLNERLQFEQSLHLNTQKFLLGKPKDE